MKTGDASLFDQDYSLRHLVEITPRGHKFRMHITPRFEGHYSNGYEVFSSRLVPNLVKKSDLFLDVGAHYGFYSLLAAEANPHMKIISVEPVPENFEILQKNMEENEISSPKGRLIRAAVGNRIGKVELFKSAASDNSGMFKHPNAPSVGKFEVQTTTIDEILREDDSKSIFIKIDTEGNELAVLKGMEKTFEKCRDLSLLLEMNPKMFKLAGTSCKEVVEYLSSKGFNVYGVDDKESKYYPLEDEGNLYRLQAENSFFNALCVKKEKSLSVAFFSHSALLAGAERSLADLVEDLCHDSVLCSVLLPSEGPLKEMLLDKGAAVHVLPECTYWWAGSHQSFNEAGHKMQLTQSMKATVAGVLPVLRQLKPDVVYTQTIVVPWGALCAEILSIPHALSVCEYGELDHHFKFSFGFQESMKAFYDSSKAIFSITESVKNEVFKGVRDKDGKIEVVYRSVRLNPGDDCDVAVQNYDYKNKAVINVAIFGTVFEGKGQEDIVQAGIALMAKGFKIKVYIIGYADPQYLVLIKDLIGASPYKDNFIIKNFVLDPIEQMKAMDIIVSCSRNEAFGRTLIEAILLGKPIIYPDSGGPKEIFVDGVHGLAYPCGDVQRLAEKLIFVIDHPDKTKQRVKAAKEYVSKKFTPGSYSGKIESRLKRIKGAEIKPHHSVMTLLSAAALVDAFLAEFGRKNAEFFEARDELANRNGQIVGLNKAVAERDCQNAGLRQQIDERDVQIVKFNQAIVKRDAQNASLIQGIAERDGQIVKLNQILAERAAQIANLTKKAAAIDGKVADLNQTVAECEKHINSLSQSLNERDRELSRAQEELQKIDSSSWWKRILGVDAPALPKKKGMARIKSWVKNLIGHCQQLIGRDTFNAEWYLKQNPDVAMLGMHPYTHYIKFGRSEGRKPTPKNVATVLLPNNGGIVPDRRRCNQQAYAIILLPIIDWHYRIQRPQQLARCFVANGHLVYYASQQFGKALALNEIETGVMGVTLPGRAETNVYADMPSSKEITTWAEALLGTIASAGCNQWVCLVQLPFWGPVAEKLKERLGCCVVYDCMDDHSGFANTGIDTLAAEEHLLTHADLVVASSQLLMNRVAPISRKAVLIRNGCDYTHFASVAKVRHHIPKKLVVGYYGAIADWFDNVMVGKLARLRPTWSFVLIGSTLSADTTSLVAQPNIVLPGEKPYPKLPELIYNWDCCIIPFKRVPLTEATNPVKVYEMLAAGKPVVAVALPELVPMAELGLIALADTAEEFARRIDQEVMLDTPERQVKRREYAQANSWADRQQSLDAAIQVLFTPTSL